MTEKAGSRPARRRCYAAIDAVRRGGTISISGVYGGQLDPLPMMQLFDKGLQIRMGQAHVRRWTDEILPLLEGDEDPLGVDDLTTHQLPLDGGAERLRDVPEEGRRGDQGRAQALTTPTNEETGDFPAKITPYRDGPYLIRGPFTLVDQDGNEIEVRRKVIALCRCGRSALDRSATAPTRRSTFRRRAARATLLLSSAAAAAAVAAVR